jgi:hypothetical protein
MRLTDKELEVAHRALAAVAEFSDEVNDPEYARLLQNAVAKMLDEKIRRQEKREAKAESRAHPSKWDRFTPGSAMNLLMEKINRDRQAAG